MKVFVRVMNVESTDPKSTFTLNLPPMGNVGNLKSALEDRFGIPTRKVGIFFREHSTRGASELSNDNQGLYEFETTATSPLLVFCRSGVQFNSKLSPASFRIFVDLLGGHRVKITVSPSDTIKYVKQQVEAKRAKIAKSISSERLNFDPTDEEVYEQVRSRFRVHGLVDGNRNDIFDGMTRLHGLCAEDVGEKFSNI